MDNETLLTLREISRRMTTLTASMESLQAYLLKLCKISALSPDLQYPVEAILASLLLMMAGQHVWQYATDRSRWTSDFTDLQSLRAHWLIAYRSFGELTEQFNQPELFPD